MHVATQVYAFTTQWFRKTNSSRLGKDSHLKRWGFPLASLVSLTQENFISRPLI